MNWYYAESGQQRGPVTDVELNQLVAAGVIQRKTLVWNETLTQWQAWSTLAPAPVPVGISVTEPDGRIRCDRCQVPFAPEDTLEISGRRVCGNCKPIVLQQLREGVMPTISGGTVAGGDAGTLSEAEFLGRDYSIDAVSAVSEAWEIMFRRPTVVWLGCVLLWAAFVGVSMLLGMMQLIPFVGLLFGPLGTLLSSLVDAGHASLFLRERRGLPNQVEGGFDFIGGRFWDILLTYLPHAVATTVMLGGMAVLGINTAMGKFGPGANRLPSLEPMLMAPLALGFLVIMVAILYLHTCFRFAPMLALDKGYRWPEALRLSWRFTQRHFWQNFWLMFLSGLVMGVGLCVCLVGAIVSYPLAYGMAAVVFDRHFRDLASVQR